MLLTNLSIVTPTRLIARGFLRIEDGVITEIGEGEYKGSDEFIDRGDLIAFPGFVDIHIHGSVGIDFMDAKASDYPKIAQSLYEEGVTTFLATTLTSDFDSLASVCETVKEVKESGQVPSLAGIHFEGPYISEKYKGAQNPAYIRNPDIEEFDKLQEISGGNVKYIAMAPEKEGALAFISHVTQNGVVVAAGHTDASFSDVEKAISKGLTNVTHTHNAMSPHHHRKPGVVTAAMYFDELFTEVICDTVHVCPDTLKAFYKIVGPDRFVAITDALKVKHTDLEKFQLFGLDCIRKPDAAYLTTGPLAGSTLSMDQALRNLSIITKADPVSLAKMVATNAACSLHLDDVGTLEVGKKGDVVLLDPDYQVVEVYKCGKKVK